MQAPAGDTVSETGSARAPNRASPGFTRSSLGSSNHTPRGFWYHHFLKQIPHPAWDPTRGLNSRP